MTSEDIKHDDFTGEIPQRAVSLYGQSDGMDDFPVLKAFQQYIDAEQEKSRKRIVMLGTGFGVVLVIVIVVFMVLLYGINSRNQILSDRLVEYAMNESSRRNASSDAGASQNDAALKAITETLQSFQKTIEEKKNPDVRDAAYDRTVKEDEKLVRAKALLATEKQRLAVEKERLHQIEIEQQRRRLYPELYEDVDSYRSSARSPSRSRNRTLTDEDIREIIREAYPERDVESSAKPARKKRDTDAGTAAETSSVEDDAGDEAIEYYKDDDYSIPVDVKGSTSKVKFTVPVE